MGLLEAAVVIYLRRLLGVGVTSVVVAPSGAVWASLKGIELAREGSTVVMILAVAVLAGRGWRQRAGAFAFVFGIWDLAYYLWLAVLVGWPRGPLDWDLLFLIPAPWWGPVLAPALIAAVLVAAGWRLMATAGREKPAWLPVALALLGGCALVVTFLLTVPPRFPWLAYAPALALFGGSFLLW